MTARQPSGFDGDEAIRALAADKTLHVLTPGPTASVAARPVRDGQFVKLEVSTEQAGEADLWLTPDEARQLATLLTASAAGADEQRRAER